MLSEEENLMKKDITFIKESNAIIDENGKNQNNDIKKNKYNLKNILTDLSDEQKILLLYSMKIMNFQDDKNFQNLLMNQSEDTLDSIIALQNDVINRFKDK